MPRDPPARSIGRNHEPVGVIADMEIGYWFLGFYGIRRNVVRMVGNGCFEGRIIVHQELPTFEMEATAREEKC